jgi:CBS domain-containing protein
MLKIKDIMIHNVYSVQKTDIVKKALEKFAEFRISGMPIVDNANRLLGYISDGDIMRHLGKSANSGFLSWVSMLGYYYGLELPASDDTQPVEEVDEFKKNALQLCSRNVLEVGVKRVIKVKEDDSLVSVAEILARRNIKKVPVVRNDVLVGIVSRGDVVRAVVKEFLVLPK